MILANKINVKHKKTGNDYAITGLSKNCTNSQSEQILVLYESLTTFKDIHFSREVGEFIKKFECPDLKPLINEFEKILSEYNNTKDPL